MSANPITVTIKSWSDLTKSIPREFNWIYRGQSGEWPLCTSLERVLKNWNVNFRKASDIEHQIIRDFRRRYNGEHQTRVDTDTLYCLALMQHHGAPTRLLDWTYSPFVAAKFATDHGAKRGAIWCCRSDWCVGAISHIVPEEEIKLRDIDMYRSDESFKAIYMNKDKKRKFVYPENPFHLNERLIIQRGAFLCPGDVTETFMENLAAMDGWQNSQNFLKLQLDLDEVAVVEVASALEQMNLNSAALFPGIDGFARSLGERLFLYTELAKRNTGKADHSRGT